MGSFLITAPDGKKYKVTGDNEQGALAALRKALGDVPAPSAAPGAPMAVPQQPANVNPGGDQAPPAAQAPAQPNPWVGAAEGVVNDLGAGMQRYNPVSLAEHRGQAVGVLRPEYPGSSQMIVDVDGTKEPVSKYPANRFVTRVENGATYVYPRTPDIAENRAASAGRLLGYGSVEQFGKLAASPAPSQATMAAREAQDLGVTPSAGMRGPVMSRIAAAGEQFGPTVSQFMGDRQRVSGEIGAAANRIADAAGPGATPVDAGSALQHGGEAFVSKVRNFQSNLYNKVDAVIPPDTPMQAPSASAFIRSKLDPLKDVPAISAAIGNNKLASVLDDLEGGKLTWTAARQLRTDLGEAIGKMSGPLTDVPSGKLKGMYAALSSDLDGAAKAAGPEAAAAWSRATTYKAASERRIETAFGKVLGKDVTPERAYSTLMNMTTSGGPSANIDALRKVFKSLPSDDAATVAGTIIRRMGRAAPGVQNAEGDVFSADTFLTNWNKMSPDARAIVASAGLDNGVGQQLSKLANVVERAKTAGTFRNTSNTAGALSTQNIWTASIASLFSGHPEVAAGIGGSAVAANISARAMTSPVFLAALNSFAASGKRDALVRLAKGSDQLALDAAKVLQLQRAAETASPQMPPSAGAPAIN